jgi:hypothetical protein
MIGPDADNLFLDAREVMRMWCMARSSSRARIASMTFK